MEYLPEKAQVRYRSKDGNEKKTYDALEWLAAMGTHVPERGRQSVRYYGFLSNAAPGRRRKDEGDDPLPTVLEPEVCSEGFGKNSTGALMIQKVYEADPLVCPKCSEKDLFHFKLFLGMYTFNCLANRLGHRIYQQPLLL